MALHDISQPRGLSTSQPCFFGFVFDLTAFTMWQV